MFVRRLRRVLRVGVDVSRNMFYESMVGLLRFEVGCGGFMMWVCFGGNALLSW